MDTASCGRSRIRRGCHAGRETEEKVDCIQTLLSSTVSLSLYICISLHLFDIHRARNARVETTSPGTTVPPDTPTTSRVRAARRLDFEDAATTASLTEPPAAGPSDTAAGPPDTTGLPPTGISMRRWNSARSELEPPASDSTAGGPPAADKPPTGLPPTGRFRRRNSAPNKLFSLEQEKADRLDRLLTRLRGSSTGNEDEDELHYAFGASIVDPGRSRGFPPSTAQHLWDALQFLINAGLLSNEFNRYKNMHMHAIWVIPVRLWDAFMETYHANLELLSALVCHNGYIPYCLDVCVGALLK